MLKRMIIENFKSFKNKTIIDLESTNYQILENKNVSENGILKGAIFVGGNATGKTNIILALKVLLDLLFAEKDIPLFLYNCLFSKEYVIKLIYEFVIEENEINYEIEYDVINAILSEKLYINKELKLDRIGSNGKSKISEATTFTDLNNSTLLLRTIYFNTKFYGNEILQKWFKFLSNSTYIDASMRAILNNNYDLVISNYLKKHGEEAINNFLEKYNFDYTIEYLEKSKANVVTFMTEKDEGKKIFFKRKSIREPIPIGMESLGNINLINMLPSFFHIINEGGMLIIDEFSNAFHNELEELLVKYFMSESKMSQLFLVSHSTNLLSNTIFRPDQEYAVDFIDNDGSIINRFSNERPRAAQNIEKMYNSGCFGGKPEYEDV